MTAITKNGFVVKSMARIARTASPARFNAIAAYVSVLRLCPETHVSEGAPAVMRQTAFL